MVAEVGYIRLRLGARDAAVNQSSPNTKIMVAFEKFFMSGDRASLLRALRKRPDAMARYCLPSTAYVIGGALKPVPTLTDHSSSSVWSSSATTVPSRSAVTTMPPAVDSTPAKFG